MASSDYDTYGQVLCKNVLMDKSGLTFHDPDDDSKKITLRVNGSMSAGETFVNLPVSATDLGAGVSDGSTAGDLLIWSGSAWSSQAMSGDATISQAGAITLGTGVVETAMIGNAQVTGAKLANGCVDAPAKLAANVVNNNALASNAVAPANLQASAVETAKINDGAVIASKLAASSVETAKINDSAVSTAKLADDCVTSAKLASAIALDTSVEAPALLVDSNKWKLVVAANNNLQFQYWNGTAWVVRHQFTPGS